MRDRRLIERSDRGAVLVIVAVFTLVAVAMLAFVVDVGGLRGEGKQATLSTDAAALAAAAVIDFSDPDATGSDVSCAVVGSTDTTWGPEVWSVADHYVTENGASLDDCRIFFGDAGTRTAYVTVDATSTVDYIFAKAIGQSGGTVAASSSARVAGAERASLFPVGLCTEGALLALGPGNTSRTFDPPLETTIVFDPACGGSGNKRQIQFNPLLHGDACGGEGMWCWDFNHGGYSGAVPQIVESDTGKDWQKAEVTINALATAKTHIWIPAVSARPDLGTNGTKAKYEITHFAEVRITSYSKRRGLGFSVFQIVPFDPAGPRSTSDVHTARVHLCGTGQGAAACDVKTAPLPPATPDPDLDFRDLCKVTAITQPVVPVRVDAASRLLVPVAASYTVENVANCDPPVVLQAVTSVRTVTAIAGARSGNTYPFTFPAGTVMGPDGTVFRLDFSENGFLVDNSVLMTMVGPCTVTSASVSPASVDSSGNKLQAPVTVRINLTRPGPCTGLTVQMVERKSNGSVNTIYVGSPAAASFDIPIAAGSETYSFNSVFDVVVIKDGAALPYGPVAFLSTTRG